MNSLRHGTAPAPAMVAYIAARGTADWTAADAEPRAALPGALAAWLAQQDFPGLRARDANGDTPLMRAAWQGEEAVVEALLACGAVPDALNDDGNSALWFACLHGGPATILRLVEAGAPIDHANDDDITCLMQAAASGRVEIVRMLLALGAAPHLSAPDGRNAFDMAADRGLELLRLARRVGGR
ncbi:ankyrin repeat domain-containing protein [Ramlibacter sp. H39-3-26]|uniref:ankyrin repeat domain-containing protein n=1 Tax=Curvibacter soli TaxID=3031331 RepID=UPI0023DB9CA0|nr:ankyrin repeat domain-containing protein [Ramlibacter sp. H39-3-26]MDF1484084.1 ankyrin repeat domain-containing protein [Ramlibacter sp. H39-3-26]